MANPSSFPNTKNEEILAFDHAKDLCCPYLFVSDKYSNLDQCMHPNACKCWLDVQPERTPDDE